MSDGMVRESAEWRAWLKVHGKYWRFLEGGAAVVVVRQWSRVVSRVVVVALE